MDIIGHVINGFAVALNPGNLFYTFVGVLLGTVVGVMPGIGSASTIALLLPVTYGMDQTSALIMMAGIFYGSMYGGSTTSILINTPGEASSMVTAIDGYQMARRGRAGAALAIAAIGSFVAGTLGIVGLTLLAVPLSSVALRFGPPEYFALMLFALSAVAALTGTSQAKGLISTLAGLLLATVGVDSQTGVPRFTFGSLTLQDGLGFTTIVVGMFAVGEALSSLERVAQNRVSIIAIKDRLMPSRDDLRRSVWPMLRGWLIGFYIGVLPGAGASIATILSYAVEKRMSKRPEEFGHGAVEGVAGPESANNASTSGALVPLLALGIPGSGTTAVMLGIFIMYGIQPGPILFKERPDLVWGLIDSMYIGNVMLLLLNLPLVGLFVRLLYTPAGILFPIILAISALGVYGVNGNVEELYIMLAMGVLGYLFQKADIPIAPLILGVVLGGPLEQSFRQALTLSAGDPIVFVSSGIALTIVALTVLSLLFPLLQASLKWRRVTEPGDV